MSYIGTTAILAMVALGGIAPVAQAGDWCWIHRAVRVGDAVKVVFSKGYTPTAVIIRADGSRTLINEMYVASDHPVKVAVRNPHYFVVLRPGDKLGIAGMDSGCTVRVVFVGGQPELKMKGGTPHVPGMPGMNSSFAHYMDVQDVMR